MTSTALAAPTRCCKSSALQGDDTLDLCAKNNPPPQQPLTSHTAVQFVTTCTATNPIAMRPAAVPVSVPAPPDMTRYRMRRQSSSLLWLLASRLSASHTRSGTYIPLRACADGGTAAPMQGSGRATCFTAAHEGLMKGGPARLNGCRLPADDCCSCHVAILVACTQLLALRPRCKP